MRVLYVAPLTYGSTSYCLGQAFFNANVELRTLDTSRYLRTSGTFLERVRYKLQRRIPMRYIQALNAEIQYQARSFQPNLTFYFPPSNILSKTLNFTSQYGHNFALFVDDMFNKANRSFTFSETTPLFDAIFTTKSYNVSEFNSAGAKRVIFINNSYSPECHQPITITASNPRKMQGDIAFVGTFRPERADLLARLRQECPELDISIWGDGWSKMYRMNYRIQAKRSRLWRALSSCVKGRELWCDDMARVFSTHKIVLGLLNPQNRDQQTSRTMEIPACGAFMLAERTDEHRRLFEEDKEAVYFSSFSELVSKVRFYNSAEDQREKIAAAGLFRCRNSAYSYYDRVHEILNEYYRLIESKDLH